MWMIPKKKNRQILIRGVLLCLAPVLGYAEPLDKGVKQLLNTPLTEIIRRQSIKVTSVSKKAENLSEAAAAIYVITAEDIRRSGATSIPEILRLAPGIQVAQVGSNKWAISARGFNDQLSNKLLVLMDGRSIYTPLFAGVNWDVQDTLIEDIDRIEVIRGPGATLWGANAVNGVINIITKNSKATPSTLVTGTIGNHEKGTAAVRKGGKVGENFYYRVYAKYFGRDEYEEAYSKKGANDSWHSYRLGFRSDWNKTRRDLITIQGDVYTTTEDRNLFLPTVTTPYLQEITEEEKRNGGNLIGRWTHKFSNNSESTLQFYYDHIARDNPSTLKQQRDTIDFDFQHSMFTTPRNEIVWGIGYRFIRDNLDDTIYLSYSPDIRSDNLYSGFIQNRFAIIPNELFLTLGSKFEHNNYTGFEYQPNARLSWSIDNKQTIWASISRAVRTPNRSEDDIQFVVDVFRPGELFPASPSGFLSQIGNRSFDSEELIAYELGYRFLPSKTLFIDTALFFNDYDNLRTLEPGTLFSFPNVALPLNIANLGKAKSYGGEIAVNWGVTKNWELSGSYSFLKIDTDIDATSNDVILSVDRNKSPKNQFNLRSHLKLPHGVEMDNTLYYVDNLSKTGIDSYLRFDTRLGWEPIRGMTINLVGQNLFDDYHPEFTAPLHSKDVEIGRSFYLKFLYHF